MDSGREQVKSPYSNSQGNCVDVELVILPDGEFVKVIDTKGKTGKGKTLLFDRGEWDAFVQGVKDGLFDWNALDADRDRPMTRGERVRLERKFAEGLARTPENLAYVNGRHAERAGWVPYTIDRFARKYHHDPNAPETAKLFEAFQTGRRAEAHDASMSGGH